MPLLLLVEDDENLRETVRDWLSFEGFTVETAADGMEALEQLSVNQFDIIVLDWNLPRINGIEVLKRYRASGGTAQILMLTGMDSMQEKQEGLRAGANAYLKKPFALHDLSKNLKIMVEKAQVK